MNCCKMSTSDSISAKLNSFLTWNRMNAVGKKGWENYFSEDFTMFVCLSTGTFLLFLGMCVITQNMCLLFNGTCVWLPGTCVCWYLKHVSVIGTFLLFPGTCVCYFLEYVCYYLNQVYGNVTTLVVICNFQVCYVLVCVIIWYVLLSGVLACAISWYMLLPGMRYYLVCIISWYV